VAHFSLATIKMYDMRNNCRKYYGQLGCDLLEKASVTIFLPELQMFQAIFVPYVRVNVLLNDMSVSRREKRKLFH
jgi:hypothetical protein